MSLVDGLLVGAIVLAAALLAGCTDSPTDPLSCVSSTESSCIASRECTLFLASDSPVTYTCRPTADRCEEGFSQQSNSQADCEADSGCRFTPGSCYCPPDLVCVCSGGPPPQCTLG